MHPLTPNRPKGYSLEILRGAGIKTMERAFAEAPRQSHQEDIHLLLTKNPFWVKGNMQWIFGNATVLLILCVPHRLYAIKPAIPTSRPPPSTDLR